MWREEEEEEKKIKRHKREKIVGSGKSSVAAVGILNFNWPTSAFVPAHVEVTPIICRADTLRFLAYFSSLQPILPYFSPENSNDSNRFVDVRIESPISRVIEKGNVIHRDLQPVSLDFRPSRYVNARYRLIEHALSKVSTSVNGVCALKRETEEKQRWRW